MTDTIQERQEEITTKFTEILVLLNSMAIDEDKIADLMVKALQKEHRTIQQTFMKTNALMIKKYSEFPYSDMRNEGAVQWSKQVAEINVNMPFI